MSVRGGRHYLYRAVDRAGKSVASLLCNDRSMESAQAFFGAAVSQEAAPWPEKINVDATAPRAVGCVCWRLKIVVAGRGGQGAPMLRDGDRPSPLQQNSADRFQPARERARRDGSVRFPRKISFGGNPYLLVWPQGGRYWHYRYSGKRKTLSLGTYPGPKCSLMVTQILGS